MTTTLAPPPAPPEAPAPPPAASVSRVPGPSILSPTIATAVAVLLASLALWPLFLGGDWLGPVILVIVAVVAAGAVATWLRAPLFLVPVIQAAVLFSLLVLLFTDDAPLGFIPSPDALSGLRAVFAEGMADIDRFAPPVPVSDGLTAVVALGVGCVALTVFVLQVSLRVPTAAGAPLIALYVVPAFVLNDGAPWWTFVLVAAAWLLLLVADERMTLVSWGRVLRRQERGPASSTLSGLSSAGFRLGAVAVLVALALPILVPGLADAVIGRVSAIPGTGEGGEGAGSGDTVTIDPFVSLARDLRRGTPVTALRYTTTDPTPGYLRLVALETFDGTRWAPGSFSPDFADLTNAVGGPVPLEVPTTPGIPAVPHDYSLTVDGLSQSYLPVPENTTTLAVDAPWYIDHATGTVFGVGSTRTQRDQQWTTTALSIEPTPAQLDKAVDLSPQTQAQLAASSNVPTVLADKARELAIGTTTKDQAAVKIQEWLRTFTYSLNVKDDGSAPALEQFLRDKVGYCQQFAATMALMARSLGIPSRVVVGFTQGTQDKADPRTWVVTSNDAHAWPELEFPGVGWVRFEPTPRGAALGGTVTVPDYTAAPPVVTTPSATLPNGFARGHGSNLDENDAALEAQLAASRLADAAAASATNADLWRARGLAALALVVGLALLVPAALRRLRRRRRLSGSVEDAWAELRDSARDLGVPWSDAQTPRQAATAVIRGQSLVGAAADATTRLARATEQVRYAPAPATPSGLADDVSTVRSALWHRAEGRARLRAVLWPASLRRTETP